MASQGRGDALLHLCADPGDMRAVAPGFGQDQHLGIVERLIRQHRDLAGRGVDLQVLAEHIPQAGQGGDPLLPA